MTQRNLLPLNMKLWVSLAVRATVLVPRCWISFLSNHLLLAAIMPTNKLKVQIFLKTRFSRNNVQTPFVKKETKGYRMQNSEFECILDCAFGNPCFFTHGVHNISVYASLTLICEYTYEYITCYSNINVVLLLF